MVIFGTGVVTGGLLVRNSQRVQFLPPQMVSTNGMQRPPQPGTPGGSRVEFLRRAERELNLTVAQRERIDKIIMASQERTKKLMEPITPRMRDEIQRAKQEFRDALTADQQVRFDELIKQQQRPHDPRRPNVPRDRESFALPAPSNSPSNP